MDKQLAMTKYLLALILFAAPLKAQILSGILGGGAPASAPITFQNFTQAAIHATDLVITAPASIVDGDTLVACIATANAETTTSTGWTSIVNGGTANILRKIASSESGDYTFSGALNNYHSGSIAHFRNASATSPIDAVGVLNSGTGATATALSIHTANANEMLVFCSRSDGSGVVGIPAGFTTCGEQDAGALEGQSCGYKAQAAAGDTGDQTASTATPWSAVMVSVTK